MEIKCPVHGLYPAVPLHYMAQVQGQLEVIDRAWCDFVCWWRGKVRGVVAAPMLRHSHAHALTIPRSGAMSNE